MVASQQPFRGLDGRAILVEEIDDQLRDGDGPDDVDRLGVVEDVFVGGTELSSSPTDESGLGDEGGSVTLSFLDTTVRSTDRDVPVSIGEPATFFVRSEKVDLDGSGDNALTGIVQNVVYEGSATNYTLAVDDRELLMTLSEGALEAGDEVWVSWDADDTVLLRE